jgi:hypothetical protein|tara:strand:+ start:992 stop:1258 length:267 start_codon:yes stop_codon:yes gene_type:complete
MNKLQKVKFHRGDRRPGDNSEDTLNYKSKMVKSKGDILWRVLEYPKKTVVAEYFFEEDANKFVKFQNKNQVWKLEGGIPKFLYIKTVK